ncbi:hypothetical protein F5Y16DRAFT_398581 [Xylariaceae sp. FL0255]|nr:hypothetical protein F5Y16DRAFT_398581 [Xylariaceae sp. FL0255]
MQFSTGSLAAAAVLIMSLVPALATPVAPPPEVQYCCVPGCVACGGLCDPSDGCTESVLFNTCCALAVDVAEDGTIEYYNSQMEKVTMHNAA